MAFAGKLGMLVVCAAVARAQYVVGAQAGTIQFTVGVVTVDGRPVHATPTNFPSLKSGQVVQTGNGRVEILLGPSVFLRLGERGAARMLNTNLQDTQVELLKGAALVEVVGTIREDRVRILRGETSIEFRGSGLYRFDVDGETVRVFGGEAEVRAGDRVLHAGRGKAVHLGAPLSVVKFDRKKTDEMHQWAARRSFKLFASSWEARASQTHWETTPTGWSWNRDFQMRLYSPVVARDYALRQSAEAQEKADYDHTLEQLHNQDVQALQQQMQQQQQAQQPQVQQQQQTPQPPSKK